MNTLLPKGLLRCKTASGRHIKKLKLTTSQFSAVAKATRHSKSSKMEGSNNNLKCLCVSGLNEVYSVWCTRFQAFAQTEVIFETLTGDEQPPISPARLGNDASDEARAARGAAKDAHAFDDIEKRKNTLLPSNSSRFNEPDANQARLY